MSQSLGSQLQGKRVGVVLSAGYFGFYGHAGFVEALRERGVEPAAWAGTSAGGLIGAFAAAGVPSADIRALLSTVRRSHFWDADFLGIAADVIGSGARTSGLLKGERFRALIESALPAKTFEALATPLVLVATNLTTQAPQVISSGELSRAVLATCAYPGLFAAVRHPTGLLWDGGIVDKAPALALRESAIGRSLDALLIHFLPSQGEAKEPSGPWAYASGMAAGFAAVRREHFRLQLEVLEARGVPAYVVTSKLPPMSPKTMHEGVSVIEAGRASAFAALEAPPRAWGGAE
jgi:NTE family protein